MSSQFKVGDVIRFHQDSIEDGIGIIRRISHHELSVEVTEVLKPSWWGNRLHTCNGFFDSDIGWFVSAHRATLYEDESLFVEVSSESLDAVLGF